MKTDWTIFLVSFVSENNKLCSKTTNNGKLQSPAKARILLRQVLCRFAGDYKADCVNTILDSASILKDS